MSFKEMMKTDVENVLLNTDEFAAEISYTPSGGTARTIKAVIEIKQPETIEEDFGRALHHMAEIFVLNDATSGIDTVSLANDRITLTDDGGTERTARILRIVNSDYASKTLLIGW